jgi:hypothetical protein
MNLWFLIFVPLDNTRKSLIPKSIPTDLFVLLIGLYIFSVKILTKYFPDGVLEIVAFFILPSIFLSMVILIPLILGIFNELFSTETN